MLRARKLGILTPVVYNVEHEASSIYMELVEGQSVRDVLMARRLDAEGAGRAAGRPYQSFFQQQPSQCGML